MGFKIIPTRLAGPKLIEPDVFKDERGFFHESYRQNIFSELGIKEEMVQDNHSRSSKGVVRGMHFQIGSGASKLVRCSRGEIFDVVVDLRTDSPTFGEWEGFLINDQNLRQVYCPIGFAHGFAVTSEVADVNYKQSNYYNDDLERGISYLDSEVGIVWPKELELIPSQRDMSAPLLSEIQAELPFRIG